MKLETMATLADVLIALAALIASIVVPVMLYQGQRRRERIEFVRGVRDFWISIDSVALQNDRLLDIADSFLDPDSSAQSMDAKRKKWLAYMVLNAMYMDFLGERHGIHIPGFSLRSHLSTILRDPDVFALTQSPSAYDEAFRVECRKIRAESKPAVRSSTPAPAGP